MAQVSATTNSSSTVSVTKPLPSDKYDISVYNANLTAIVAAITALNAALDDIIVDTALSSTSTNPVQNSVVTKALDTKASMTHLHPIYLPVSGGTMTGALVAQANTNYTTYQVRNVALSTSAAVPTGTGSLLGVYS